MIKVINLLRGMDRTIEFFTKLPPFFHSFRVLEIEFHDFLRRKPHIQWILRAINPFDFPVCPSALLGMVRRMVSSPNQSPAYAQG
jgi:hypothetical protein